MRLSVETITPTRAEEILLHSANTRQRKLSPRRVETLVDAIRRGQWKTTHQPIALDASGVCFDGQHRLTAIAASGQSVDVLVAYDADPETFDVLDLRGTRTTGDSLHIAGYTNTLVLGSVVRLVLIYDKVKGTRTAVDSRIRASVTSTDVLETLESDRGDHIAAAIAPAGAIARAVNRSGAVAAIAATLVHIREAGAPEDLVEQFVDDLVSGAMLPTTSPLYAFRRWLGGNNGYERLKYQQRSSVTIAILIKTWNAWVTGRDVTTLYFRSGEDYPLVIPNAGIDLEELEAHLRAQEEQPA